MKRIFFILLAFALTATYLQGQKLEQINLPPPSEVAKEYRPEYRRLLKEDAKRQEENKDRDIKIPPEEQVPTEIVRFVVAQMTNWGVDLLSSAALAQRIKDECTHKVVIKVTDTGGKFSHTALQKGQLPGSSYTGEPSLDDGNGHGLHCAGIIAADKFGLAFPLVEKGLLTFKPVKVLTNSGSGSFTWVSNCYASERANDQALLSQGIGVVYSGSFGGGTAIIPDVEAQIAATANLGAFMVYAAGNTGGPVNYPGMSPFAITTASLDQSMAVSSYSSRGPEIDNAMPGRNINSTYKDNTYATLSGTSMATPFLSAAVAIALSKYGKAAFPTTAAMKAYLQKVATDITPPGRDDPSGWGVVFVRAILDTAPGGTPPPPPPPPPPPVEKVQIVTTVTDGFTIRYRLDGDQADRILQIREIEMFTDGATAEASIDQARQYCREFFPNHQIVQIPKAEGLQGGAYWAGQFFEYWGRNNAKPLQVIRLVGVDELGRSLTVTGFDRAEVPQGYDQPEGPVLRKR